MKRLTLLSIIFLFILITGRSAVWSSADSDSDGIPDHMDNCVEVYNPGQEDSNASEDDNIPAEGEQHYGNACDPDFDNDGITGLTDFNDLRSCFGKEINDAPDCVHVDCDGDGLIGLYDFNCLRTYFGKSPGPGREGASECDGNILCRPTAGYWLGENVSFEVSGDSSEILDFLLSYSGSISDDNGSSCFYHNELSDPLIPLVTNSLWFKTSTVTADWDYKIIFKDEKSAKIELSFVHKAGCGMEIEGIRNYDVNFIPDPCLPVLDLASSSMTIPYGGSTDVTADVSVIHPPGCPEGVEEGLQASFSISDPGSTGSSLSTDLVDIIEGEGVVELNAGNNAGLVTVNATVEDSKGNLSTDNLDVTIKNPCDPAKPVLQASITQIPFVTGSALITATIPEAFPDVCPLAHVDPVNVSFSLNDPVGTGSTLSVNSATTVNGKTAVTLNAGAAPGELTVTAAVEDSQGNVHSTSINIDIIRVVGSVSMDAQSVYVSGSYAYVAAGFEGLKVVDVSDPASPFIAASVDTLAFDVHVSGSYAYMADFFGLTILNISDPTDPWVVKTIDLNEAPEHIFIQGAYAYTTSMFGGLDIINISDPPKASLAGSIQIPGAASVHVSGIYAYVVDNDNLNIKVVNISNPENPVLHNTIDTYAKDTVSVSGQYVYVGSDNKIKIIDIGDLSNPSVSGSLTLALPQDIFISGSYAYVANLYGLVVVDISDPGNPVRVEFIDTSAAVGVFVSGSYAYVADEGMIGNRGLKVVDLSGL